MSSARILVADDHDLIRRGLKALLESHHGWEICGEAHTGSEAVGKAQELKPDIAILDIGMPDLNGLEAARKIRKASPQTKILVLSVHYSDQLIRDTVETGVHGYIVKSDSDRDLVRAVEALTSHKPFFTPRATEVLASTVNVTACSLASNQGAKDRHTSREREVVQLLCAGRTSREVAERLGTSIKTVETHRANIMGKLEIHSVTQLVRYAVRNQIAQA
jgi:DNA-binding NarL/FixJ family response regulator